MARFANTRFPKTYALLSAAPRLAASLWWMRYLERHGVGQRLTRLDFGARRTSDTIFVLGTGASINDYPASWWSVIGSAESVAMNFFLLHEHVPTYHVVEDVHGIRARLLARRYVEIGDYRDVPLIVKTQLTNLSYRRVRRRIDELAELPSKVRESVYLSLDFLAAGATVEEMESAYRSLAKLGLWEPRDRFLALTKRRGSVSYAINLAVRAGYRRIVLCGIDLNHTEYFYDSRRERLEKAGLPVPINDEPGTVHSTNDPERNPVTIHQVILGIRDIVLQPRGIELMVAAPTSALYPDLPLFDWAAAPTGRETPSSQNYTSG
jgi:hypothetical protein